MEATFEIKAFSKTWLLKHQRPYNTDVSEEVEDSEDQEEQEVEKDLITTCAVVYKIIFILMNLIYKSIFNILKIIWYTVKPFVKSPLNDRDLVRFW